MGILALVEDRPTPKAVYNWRVYTCALVASWASCMIGYDSAFIGTTLALPSFTAEFEFAKLTPGELNNTKANIVSVYQAGAFFGSLAAYVAAYHLGRKKSLYIYAAIFCVGSGIMLAAKGSVGLGPILAGRVLAGIGVGGASMIVPIYISELSPPAIRGRLVGIYELGWQLGGLVGFWINYILLHSMAATRTQWMIPFGLQLVPGGFLLIGTFFLKESPRWLLSKGRRAEALKNLTWIRNLDASDTYIVEEVSFLDAALDEQASTVGLGFWKPFIAVGRDRNVQWRFFIGGMLFLWQNGSGINAINYYSPTVFKAIGFSADSTFLMTGLFGVVKTVLTFVWLLYLIDNLGRRLLLLIGSAGGSICMWIIGGYVNSVTIDPKNPSPTLSSGGIAAAVFFYLWTSFYTPSWNGTVWVQNSEIFDQNTRSLGQASAAANNWFWNFIISRFTPNMFASMGKNGSGVFFFFASMMIASMVFVYFLVPETKGVPLESMDRLFAVKPVRKAHKVIIAENAAMIEDMRSNSISKTKVSVDEQEV